MNIKVQLLIESKNINIYHTFRKCLMESIHQSKKFDLKCDIIINHVYLQLVGTSKKILSVDYHITIVDNDSNDNNNQDYAQKIARKLILDLFFNKTTHLCI